MEKALAAQRPEGELEQPFRHRELGATGISARGRSQAVPVAEIDRDALGAHQIGDPGDCGLERVRE